MELVQRSLFSSLEKAREAISNNCVLVNGAVASKAARMISVQDQLLIKHLPVFVSRAGLKLQAALEEFDIAVDGLEVLDAGASTGGFSDCLLQKGACRVVAIDVGHGQLHPKIRNDPRVLVKEKLNLKDVQLDDIDSSPFELIVVDLSFISLKSVSKVLVEDLLDKKGQLLILVKPQFEASRVESSKAKGVIKDSHIWSRVLKEVIYDFQSRQLSVCNAMVSPITGSFGNVEFLLHLCTKDFLIEQNQLDDTIDIDDLTAQALHRQGLTE